MVSKLTFFLLVLSTCFISSQSRDFYVGGDQGWVVHPSQDYTRWAHHNRFQVGDSLVFKYNKGSDSVLLVHEADFNNCNKNNPVYKWDDGNSVFNFEHSGPFYFISGEGDHCQQGQKLVVIVLYPRTHVPSPAPVPMAHSPSPAPVAHSPSPVPVSYTPSPAPVAYTPSPAPAHQAPSPSPVAYTPSPAPAQHTPSPAPAHQTPTPAPAHQAPTPAPAHQAPTPAPAQHTPSPAPTADTPTQGPGQQQTPAPAGDEPSSEPPASSPSESDAPAPAPKSFASSVTPSSVCIFFSTLLASLACSSFMGVI